MRDKLAEEMDRRVDALEPINVHEFSDEVKTAIETIKRYCKEHGAYQQFRHSEIYLLNSEMALVEWD